ncbi:hypothetical protein COCON_G00000910 [Conger conger]|uniref:Uncharacterized protein n=1 Tax=Conger conger TaxID=82655 RepID=A0A9Q1E0L7_CONCO|nr:hypothetical protein COCON_G00000910 [Conger conger]
MAVQSHSFQGNLERTEKPEKIRLVANPAKEQENTAGEFHQKRKDEKLKGGEHQRTEAGEWRSEERDGPPASGRECRSRSRSVSTATRSSSVTSGSSGGRRGNRRNHGKRRSRRSRRSRSSSSNSRSRCHRAPARSRCRRGGRRSPPRRYRARSRSYSPSHSPARRCPAGPRPGPGPGPLTSTGPAGSWPRAASAWLCPPRGACQKRGRCSWRPERAQRAPGGGRRSTPRWRTRRGPCSPRGGGPRPARERATQKRVYRRFRLSKGPFSHASGCPVTDVMPQKGHMTVARHLKQPILRE